MATASLTECTKFKTALGSEELILELDSERCQLSIELANASRYVVHRKTLEKPEEIRQITGN